MRLTSIRDSGVLPAVAASAALVVGVIALGAIAPSLNPLPKLLLTIGAPAIMAGEGVMLGRGRQTAKIGVAFAAFAALYLLVWVLFTLASGSGPLFMTFLLVMALPAVVGLVGIPLFLGFACGAVSRRVHYSSR